MNWIVKNEPKQPKPETYEERIARVLVKTGTNPADWTDEELDGPEGSEGWRTISENRDLMQAARMEWTRRQKAKGLIDENAYEEWTLR